MPTQFKPGDVESALVELLKAIGGTDVRGATATDFDTDGNLVTRVVQPTILVHFEIEESDRPRELTRTTYSLTQIFSLFCFQQSLRGTKEEREATYGLVALVRDAVAGARLTLADGHTTAPTIYMGSRLNQFNEDGTWYEVRCGPNTVAQFTAKS